MTRSILITGCSSGIGYHCAHALHARGWRVLATCRKPEDAERLELSFRRSRDSLVTERMAQIGRLIASLELTEATTNVEEVIRELEAIKQMLTFVPMALMSLALVLARFYTLDNDQHTKIREALRSCAN